MKKNRTGIVYSTEFGKMCPECGNPAAQCICKQKSTTDQSSDGIVRLRREVKGRKGKTVTTVAGIPGDRINELAKQLKQKCGTGGSKKEAEQMAAKKTLEILGIYFKVNDVQD